MRRMGTIFRNIFGVTAVAFTVVAFVYNGNTAGPNDLLHPNTDPQFADLVERGYDPSNSARDILAQFTGAPAPTSHEVDYAAAIAAYDQERSRLEVLSQERETNFQGLLAWAAIFGCLSLVITVPWRRLIGRVHKSSKTAAFEAGKLTGQCVNALTSITDSSPSPIIGRSGMKSYSVADELQKWSKLHDEGVVTDAEFDEARNRLLNRVG